MSEEDPSIEFDTRLKTEGSGCFIEIDADVEAVFGRKRVPVVVTIETYRYRTTIARMGGRFLVPVSRLNRENAGVSAGDVVRVRITLDDEPRRVTLPDDFRQRLESARLVDAWQALSYTHQKEHVDAIEDAKRPQTRHRRIEKAIAMLKARS